MLAAAAELFGTDGYGRTTLAKIAAAAGVSTETVQGHGPKADLLIAAAEFAAVGVSGEENILNLDLGRELVAIGDPQPALEYLVAVVAEVHKRTAQLTPALLGGAQSDPELDRYVTEFIAGITGQFRRVLEIFRERGWVRGDVAFDELVETAAVLGSAEVYLRMTHRGGWTVGAYQRWLARMLAETVFGAPNFSS